MKSESTESGGIFGVSVAGVEDADGDGRGDLLVGASSEGPGEIPFGTGRAYLFSGATGTLLFELHSPNGQTDGRFGLSVAGVPDADGDGRGDLLVGADWEDPGASPDQAGRAYLFSGATGTLLHELHSPNEEAGGWFGHSVAGVPDTDGDGRGDLLVGTFSEGAGSSPSGAGRAYLFSGATGALLFELQSPNEETDGHFGHRVAGASDTDGDGRGDLLIGAFFEDPGASPDRAGRAYLFSGATGALLFELRSPNEETDGRFEASVAGVPDADGDGRGDLLVGASSEDPGASPDEAGRAYLFSGATGTLLFELHSPNEEKTGLFGDSAAGVEDADGDGRGDLLVGAPYEGPSAGPNDAGRAYLFSGATGALLFELHSPNAEENGLFGYRVAGVEDADGDGRGDLFVGAHFEDPGASPEDAGRAYLFSGLVAPNVPPTAVDDVAEANEDEALIIDVLDNDRDVDGTLDPASVTVTSDPSNGTITAVHPTIGAILYDPEPGFIGIDTFTYTVQDNDGAASNPATVSVIVGPITISGTIVRPDLTMPVEGVTLGVTGDLVHATTSAADGRYSLPVGEGGDYTVTPVKADDAVGPANGVNVLDIALVRQHILNPGSTPLSTPYRIIAGDVDASDAINVLDVVSMRQLILAQTSTFGAGLWRFVSSAYIFSDPTHPLAEDFAEAHRYTDLTSDQVNQDFLAVRLGDVDESWTPAGAMSKHQAVAGTVHLEVGSPEAADDDEVLVPIRVRGFREVGGVQFTLAWNADELAYAGIATYELPGLRATHFGEAHVREGVLTVAWDDPALEGVSLPDGTALFAVGFRALKSGAASVEITSSPTALFAHRGRDLAPLALEVEPSAAATAEVPATYALHANYPNPFNPTTTIRFDLPEAGPVLLAVYDVLGRRVALLADEPMQAGMHEMRFDAAQLPSGVYLYRLTAGSFTQTRHMVLLK